MSDEQESNTPELTDNQELFLEAIRQVGFISHAAKRAGIERRSHYRWLDESPAYAEAFEDANCEFDDRLRAEAVRRAVKGVNRTIYYKGQPCGQETEYSDRLLEVILKARCTEFREKHDVSGGGRPPVQVLAIEYPALIEDPEEWSRHYRPKDPPADRDEEDSK